MLLPNLSELPVDESTIPEDDCLSIRQAVFWLAGLNPSDFPDYKSYNPLDLSYFYTGRRFRSALFWFSFIEQFVEYMTSDTAEQFWEEKHFSRLSFSDVYGSSYKFTSKSLNDPKKSERWKRLIGESIVRGWNLRLPCGGLNTSAMEAFQLDYKRWSDFFQFTDGLTERLRDAMWELDGDISDVVADHVTISDDRLYSLSFHENALITAPLQRGSSVGVETWRPRPVNTHRDILPGKVFDRSKLLELYVAAPAREFEHWRNRISSWKAWPLSWVIHLVEFNFSYQQLKSAVYQADDLKVPIYWITFPMENLLEDTPIRTGGGKQEKFLDACRAGQITCYGYYDDEFRLIEPIEWAGLEVFVNADGKSLEVASMSKGSQKQRYTGVVVERSTYEAWQLKNTGTSQAPEISNETSFGAASAGRGRPPTERKRAGLALKALHGKIKKPEGATMESLTAEVNEWLEQSGQHFVSQATVRRVLDDAVAT